MSYDLPSYEGWDCPTCMRPMEKEDDHECSTCGLNASEHLSVTSLCRILRDVSGREAALIVERDKLNSLLIRLYNDIFVHKSGTAVAELKKMFREPNYN